MSEFMMKWPQMTSEDRQYFRELVSDYTKEEDNDYIPQEPDELTADDIEMLYKLASTYYRTDEPEIKFNGEV